MSNKVAIHEKLMAVRLNCSFGLANRITDKQITAETNAAKETDNLQVKKELFPGDAGKHLKALQSTLAEFYQYHAKVTMSSVNRGEVLLPVAFYLDYMKEFSTYDAKVEEKFEEFESNYDQCVQQVAQHPKWGKTFNAADYPDKDELHKYLKFKVQTLPLPQADTLLNVIGESVQADVDAYLDEAMSQALADVNTRIKTSLQRMVEQLSDPKKKVYDSLTASMLELVSYVPSFNVVEDDSLNLLAQEIKDKLLVHSTDTLRHDVVARRNVAAEAADILKRMG